MSYDDCSLSIDQLNMLELNKDKLKNIIFELMDQDLITAEKNKKYYALDPYIVHMSSDWS